jgi:peptidoglycan/xylan/chitin deacetylase (PgdA/CDA1 family)
LFVKQRYIGSVRFFKNLILLVVIVAITVPSVLAFRYHGQLSALRGDQPPVDAASSASGSAAAAASVDAAAPVSQFSADEPEYEQLYPDFYAPQPLTADQTVNHAAYLTFDDGPSIHTDEILATLKEKNATATFFVVGKDDAESVQHMKDIVASGCTLGMHSYSHKYKQIYASVEDYLADMYDLFCLIRESTGTTPTVFRMPGGSINGYDYGIYQQILSEMLRRGFVPYDWNLSIDDAIGVDYSASQLLHNVIDHSATVNRAIILMHDNADNLGMLDALPLMIDALREQGFTLEAITPDTRPVLFNYES